MALFEDSGELEHVCELIYGYLEVPLERRHEFGPFAVLAEQLEAAIREAGDLPGETPNDARYRARFTANNLVEAAAGALYFARIALEYPDVFDREMADNLCGHLWETHAILGDRSRREVDRERKRSRGYRSKGGQSGSKTPVAIKQYVEDLVHDNPDITPDDAWLSIPEGDELELSDDVALYRDGEEVVQRETVSDRSKGVDSTRTRSVRRSTFERYVRNAKRKGAR